MHGFEPKRRSGLTLIELLIVVSIIALVSTMYIGVFVDIRKLLENLM